MLLLSRRGEWESGGGEVGDGWGGGMVRRVKV